MAFVFVEDGAFDGAEAVEVFDFGTSAELGIFRLFEGDVDVKTHVAIIEVAVGDAGVSHVTPEFFAVIASFFGARHIWHRDDF